jgi:hypothetical protein
LIGIIRSSRYKNGIVAIVAATSENINLFRFTKNKGIMTTQAKSIDIIGIPAHTIALLIAKSTIRHTPIAMIKSADIIANINLMYLFSKPIFLASSLFLIDTSL